MMEKNYFETFGLSGSLLNTSHSETLWNQIGGPSQVLVWFLINLFS